MDKSKYLCMHTFMKVLVHINVSTISIRLGQFPVGWGVPSKQTQQRVQKDNSSTYFDIFLMFYPFQGSFSCIPKMLNEYASSVEIYSPSRATNDTYIDVRVKYLRLSYLRSGMTSKNIALCVRKPYRIDNAHVLHTSTRPSQE